jgi:hypothetical protein
MNDADTMVQYADTDIEMRFEELEVTPELLMTGLTFWNAPIKGVATRLNDAIRDLFEVSWNAWPATVGVSQISISTEPNPLPTAWTPPEFTWARVSIFGFGFAPGAPVTTKWNNAFGFPDNGVGANSIQLQTPIPDANGRFAFQVIHRAVPRPAAEWRWEANAQLVIVAQQGVPGSPSWLQAHQRYIPPHVLWQWVPYSPNLISP